MDAFTDILPKVYTEIGVKMAFTEIYLQPFWFQHMYLVITKDNPGDEFFNQVVIDLLRIDRTQGLNGWLSVICNIDTDKSTL